MYVEISPSRDRDYDIAVFPLNTEKEKDEAFDYAQDVIQDMLDDADGTKDGETSEMTFVIHGGDIPSPASLEGEEGSDV